MKKYARRRKAMLNLYIKFILPPFMSVNISDDTKVTWCDFFELGCKFLQKNAQKHVPKTSQRRGVFVVRSDNRGRGRFYRPKIYISVREVLPQVIKHVARDPSRRGHDKTPLIYFIRGSETYSKRQAPPLSSVGPSSPGAVFGVYPSVMTFAPCSPFTIPPTCVLHPYLCPTDNISAVLLTTHGPFSRSSPGAFPERWGAPHCGTSQSNRNDTAPGVLPLTRQCNAYHNLKSWYSTVK